MSLTLVKVWDGVGSGFIVGFFLDDQRADGFAECDPLEVPLFGELEHDEGKVVVHAQTDGGRVHDLQVLIQDRKERDLAVLLGRRIFDRIGVVNPVNLGSFEDHLRADFHGPQRGGGVGREIGVAGAAGKDDDAIFFQMTDGPPADISFGQLAHFDGGLDSGDDADPLKSILERESIHNGGQHAHVVGRGPFHAGRAGGKTSENGAAA